MSNQIITKNMKVKELFNNIESMIEQIESGKETSLFMLGTDDVQECGVVRGKEKNIISMIVTQMVNHEEIERIIMVAADAFINYAEHQKKLANNPNIS